MSAHALLLHLIFKADIVVYVNSVDLLDIISRHSTFYCRTKSMNGFFQEMDPLDADRTKMQVVRGKREREQNTNKAFKGSWLQLIN